MVVARDARRRGMVARDARRYGMDNWGYGEPENAVSCCRTSQRVLNAPCRVWPQREPIR